VNAVLGHATGRAIRQDGPVSQPRTTEPDLPELPDGWTARIPELDDLPALVALRIADQQPWTGATSVDEAGIESEIAGPASWTRRQLVAADDAGTARGWITVHDRAAGRAVVAGYFDRTIDVVDRIADAFYAWAEGQAVALARLRGIDETRLDESPFQNDKQQVRWLRRAGYTKRRSWLHMERPVTPDDVGSLPSIREGVTIRPVSSHHNGLPVAGDLQLVHLMLEESFEDHFNSYRESFPEFVQRLREDPGHRWDHWWLAYVAVDGHDVPAGALVCSVLSGDASGREGSYVEYIGVNRAARGRGVAKGLLHTLITDAAERGRNRVALEVDDDSPTSADQLYVSMGWKTHYVTDSWLKDIPLG
jgi:GNAT superfamily N-acetyltransferase